MVSRWRKWQICLVLLLWGAVAQAQLFEDATAESGIDYFGESFGIAVGDLNGDDYPDIFTSNHFLQIGNLPSIWINRGDGTFKEKEVPSYYAFPDFHGATIIDFDGDGDEDLFVANGKRSPNHIYVNEGGGIFIEKAAELGLADSSGRGRSFILFDADKDADLDLILCKSAPYDTVLQKPTQYFIQNSWGVFEEATEQANLNIETDISYGILSDIYGEEQVNLVLSFDHTKDIFEVGRYPFLRRTHPEHDNVNDILSADFNGDLIPDLYLSRIDRISEINEISDSLWSFYLSPRNAEHGIQFISNGSKLRVDKGGTDVSIYYGSGGHDLGSSYRLKDSDSLLHGIMPHDPGIDPGIFVGWDSLTGFWQVSYSSNSPTNGIVFELKDSVGGLDSVSSLGFDHPAIFPSDVILFGNHSASPRESDSSGLPLDHTSAQALAGDFDLDMDLDIYVNAGSIANAPNRLFLNDGHGNFTEADSAGGAMGSNIGKAGELVSLDYNLDGSLDLFMSHGHSRFFDGPYQLYKGVPNGRHWLLIDLIGTESNRAALGAFVKVYAGGVGQLRVVDGGYHRYSQNHKRLHFGLDSNSIVDSIVVKWPNGTLQVLDSISADQVLQITEPETCDEPRQLRHQLDSDSAHLSWNPEPFTSSYQLKVTRLTSPTQTRNIICSDTAFSFPIQPGKDYEWLLRSDCPDGWSSFSEPDSFTSASPRVHLGNDYGERIKIYPNPTYEQLHVFLPEKGSKSIILMDGAGRIVESFLIHDGDNLLSLDRNRLENGFYNLIIKDSQGFHTSRRLLLL